jgi:diacylglycerol kinase family enzyme
LKTAAAARPPAIVVGGGDGTVRSAATVLAGTGIAMGVLPLGTLNHFARDLGIPVSLESAIAALPGSSSKLVDVGEVNGQVFINNCSLGAYADAVRRRDALRATKSQGKWRAMARASWLTFRRLKLLRLSVAADEETSRVLRTPLVVVGNNRYTGRLLSRNLRPKLDEGRLWLYAVHAHRHLAVLRLMMRSLVRDLDEAETLSAFPATRFEINGLNGPIAAAADGEVLTLQMPLRFRIRSRVLKVLAPRNDEDQK